MKRLLTKFAMTCVLAIMLTGALLSATVSTDQPTYPYHVYGFVHSRGKIQTDTGDTVLGAFLWVEDAGSGDRAYWNAWTDGKTWSGTSGQIPPGDYYVYPSINYKTKDGQLKPAFGTKYWLEIP